MGLFDQAFAHLGQITKELGQPKGEVRVDCEPRVGVAGTVLAGHTSFTSPDRVRHVKTFSVHFQLATTRIQHGVDHTGKPSIAPVTESRDLIAPVSIATDVSVAPGAVLQGPLEITLPAGLPPSMPGQLDYYLVARADVVDQLIDPWAQLPIVVGAGHATAVGLAPGAPCVARGVDGIVAPAMVVEARGAVTFVQWADGRAASWVPSETVRTT